MLRDARSALPVCTGGDDGDGEGWGSREDLAAVIRHVAEDPDPWGVIGDQIAEERKRKKR